MSLPPTDHKTDPRLCFRPGGKLTRQALVALLECGTIGATPRLGLRDATHPKGYYPEQVVTVCVCEETARPCIGACMKRRARITKLMARPLSKLTAQDLHDTGVYNNWQDVQRDLSYFEDRKISPTEQVTIVHFEL